MSSCAPLAMRPTGSQLGVLRYVRMTTLVCAALAAAPFPVAAADSAHQNGAIAGNIYLRGGGDALLRSKDLDDAAAALAAQGVKSISGALITDASHYDAQRWGYGWSWDDLPYYYAPVVTALE